MATQPVSPFATFAASTQTPSTSSTSSTGIGGSAPNEQMFLQLLVAQIKNQDPMNPSDSTQFVSQLAQFSELEQVIAIRQDADAMKPAASTTGKQPTGTSGS